MSEKPGIAGRCLRCTLLTAISITAATVDAALMFQKIDDRAWALAVIWFAMMVWCASDADQAWRRCGWLDEVAS